MNDKKIMQQAFDYEKYCEQNNIKRCMDNSMSLLLRNKRNKGKFMKTQKFKKKLKDIQELKLNGSTRGKTPTVQKLIF